MSVSMVKRFRSNFLRANVRDGADAIEKIRKTDYVTHNITQETIPNIHNIKTTMKENSNFHLIVMEFSLVKV